MNYYFDVILESFQQFNVSLSLNNDNPWQFHDHFKISKSEGLCILNEDAIFGADSGVVNSIIFSDAYIIDTRTKTTS